MAYVINKSDGTFYTTIADGTVDTSTDLKLIGKNYLGFGKAINENFLSLLENFSDDNSPNSPLSGQLWWDRSNQQLKVFNGTIFEPLGVMHVSTTQPPSASAGDLWYDSTNQQLKQFNGSIYKLIGPAYTAAQGVAGISVDTIAYGTSSTQNVIRVLVDNTTLAIISPAAQFTPTTSITGFSSIKPGINLNSTLNLKFQGTATNSDALGGLASTSFLRSDQASSTTGTITVANNDGLIFGSALNGRLNTNSLGHVILENSQNNKNVYINVNKNNVQTSAIVIDGATANVSVDNLAVYGTLSVNNIVGALVTGAQNNITSVGTLNNLIVSTTITTANLIATGNISGTLTTAAQPNITSVGTLNSLTVLGAVTAGSATLGTPLPIASGGTGASTAAAALTLLGAVNKSGDTLTGFLNLHAAPTSDLHASTKKYVDDTITSSLSGYATQSWVATNSPPSYSFTYGQITTVAFQSNNSSSTNFNNNYFDILPPSGKTMSNFVAIIPSINTMYLTTNSSSGDITMRADYEVRSDRVRVRVQASNQFAAAKGNYLAIWSN